MDESGKRTARRRCHTFAYVQTVRSARNEASGHAVCLVADVDTSLPLALQPTTDVNRPLGIDGETWDPTERKTTQSQMGAKEQRSVLRAAVYRRDGAAVVHLLGGVGAADDSLQLAGDGVIAALMQRVDGAPELARDLVVALRHRGWDGDDELADELDALLGGPAPMLRALPVDLEELAGILEGDPLTAGGRIDVRTGEVWPQAAIEYALESGEEDEDSANDPERWLPVHGEGSREGYRDMELFIASVEDPDRAERLAIAIRGRGAFRRFKDELGRWPGELERWYAFAEERHRGRARLWLAEAGYRALPAEHHGL